MEPHSLKAFISYSHEDKVYFKLLVKGLKSHSAGSPVFNWNFWDDRNIPFGADWHATIQQQIAECNFGLLFVSADFINSEYIKENEFNNFIAKNVVQGFLFLPVLVRDCNFLNVEALAKIQFFSALGEDYGIKGTGNKLIPFAELVRFDNDGDLIPNPKMDTYFKNLVKTIETVVLNHKQVAPKPLLPKLSRNEKEVIELLKYLRCTTNTPASDQFIWNNETKYLSPVTQNKIESVLESLISKEIITHKTVNNTDLYYATAYGEDIMYGKYSSDEGIKQFMDLLRNYKAVAGSVIKELNIGLNKHKFMSPIYDEKLSEIMNAAQNNELINFLPNNCIQLTENGEEYLYGN
ncbi:MAG TPA: hypothetical protein DCQ31_18180 [Bacteroidales bacterium]|nr:hypothetical protein [Bacteroidales bacterium]